MFFQAYALVEHCFPPRTSPRHGWLMPTLVWVMFTTQYPILLMHAAAGIARHGDRTFIIADVHEASVSAALFTTLFASLIALVRLANLRELSQPMDCA